MQKVNTPDHLVSALQTGSQKAFSELYDMYSPNLYGLIHTIVKDTEVANDLLQECFINIWKKAPQYSPEKGSFFTWSLNICRNKSIDYLRKQKRERDYVESGAKTNPDAQTLSFINTNIIGLREMIQKLPEEQQIIIDYLYFRGFTQSETAEALDLPLGTVKTRARMAIKGLKGNFILLAVLWILKNI